jgi:V8-like Glu-specific endopeptidase
MARRTGHVSMAAPSAALAVALAAGCAASTGSTAPAARATGCVKVQTLTYGGASGADPASARQCVPEAALITAVSATAPQASSPATAAREIPTVGKLTFRVDGVVSLNCTATVIDGTAAANSEELIVTAAHCLEGTIGHVAYTSTNLVFSPMWHDGKNPFGTWTVKKAFLNGGWLTCSIPVADCKTNQLYDYAVVVLSPKNGKGIGDVTGADGWSVNQPKTIASVTIAGIPATSPGILVTTTSTNTVTESGEPFRQAATPGFTDGSSGGPWFRNFSTTTSLGVLIGDTGGFEQGGPSSGSPSYSNYWTGSFAAVIKAAVSFEG